MGELDLNQGLFYKRIETKYFLVNAMFTPSYKIIVWASPSSMKWDGSKSFFTHCYMVRWALRDSCHWGPSVLARCWRSAVVAAAPRRPGPGSVLCWSWRPKMSTPAIVHNIFCKNCWDLLGENNAPRSRQGRWSQRASCLEGRRGSEAPAIRCRRPRLRGRSRALASGRPRWLQPPPAGC